MITFFLLFINADAMWPSVVDLKTGMVVTPKVLVLICDLRNCFHMAS